MNERPLPEDLAHWPEDPNELLGVSYGVTPRDLHRAYNRLIRIYKPEQFPEQFRRIREAYEYLLRIAQMFAPQTEATDSPSAEEASILSAPQAEEALEQDNISPPPRRPQEEMEELWEAAITGRPAAAYERLVQLTQQSAGRIELYQRLYWLLTLWPDLDGRRVAADWLVQGLLATGMAGPLRELYREEVADNPAEAISERYERLLDAPVSAGLLADLIEWRFQAAVRLDEWEILDADLSKLRSRFAVGEEQLWLRLLFSLADDVAWAGEAEGARLLTVCREEIARHEHLASTMSHSFDRIDLLVEASFGAFGLVYQSRVPKPMLRLIGGSWSRPLGEFRELLMEVLEAIAGAPQRWLSHLDEMHQLAPLTLALFGELLDRFEEAREMIPERPRERELTKGLILSFLPRLDVADYDGERTRLLRFCIREDIAPEEMAQVASEFIGGWEELGASWRGC